MLLIANVLCSTMPASAEYAPARCLNSPERKLIKRVNEYRAEHGLPAVPVSRSLTTVAQWHAADTAYAIEVTGDWLQNPSCNLHTWYGIPGAPYGTCCYTPDHAQAACMWDKPAEITHGFFAAAAVENASIGYASPSDALEGWKSSAGHNSVILNRGTWARFSWNAMGVAVDPEHRSYFLWFSETADPSGPPPRCKAGLCPETVDRSCRLEFPNTTLRIDERQSGRETLVVKWRGGPALLPSDYGDPVERGGTKYAACVYDDRDRLVAEYSVRRPGRACGARPCWSEVPEVAEKGQRGGYAYDDPMADRFGLYRLRLKAAKRGLSKIVVKGRNDAAVGSNSLPTGVSSALEGARRATVQFRGTDMGSCATARLDEIVANDRRRFEAEN